MKKSILFAGLLMVSALFIGCTNDGTPASSSTKLWPAAQVSKDSQTGEQTVKWGFIDAKGQMVIAAAYDKAYDFSCGLAKLVSYSQTGEASYYYINESQEMQTIPSNEWIDDYFYYNYVQYEVSGGLYGLFNKKFETAIQPAYKYLGDMSVDGLVYFKQSSDTKFGYLNEKNEVAIPAQYDDAYGFVDGYAVVKMGDNYGLIDKKGGQSITYQTNTLVSVGEDRIAFVDKGTRKWGLMDTKGTIKVQAIYDSGSPYGFTDEGVVAVYQNQKWGYVDKNGKSVLTVQFVEAYPFYGGMAWIKRSETSNYEAIDIKGNTKITLGKNEVPMTFFRQGLCLVRKYVEGEGTTVPGYEYSYIDEKGAPVYSWKIEGYASANPAGYGTSLGGGQGYYDYDDDYGYDDEYENYYGDEYYAPSYNKINVHQLMAPTRYGNRVRK
ncbi:MAG: WG repeat-containing protein [Paludibacteraceae bacterium]|nr:WG repeat-containing protein [Paludibacteraceae bacterium]